MSEFGKLFSQIDTEREAEEARAQAAAQLKQAAERDAWERRAVPLRENFLSKLFDAQQDLLVRGTQIEVTDLTQFGATRGGSADKVRGPTVDFSLRPTDYQVWVHFSVSANTEGKCSLYQHSDQTRQDIVQFSSPRGGVVNADMDSPGGRHLFEAAIERYFIALKDLRRRF